MKEIEEFVGKVLGSDKMTKNMSLTERQEQFGKTFASNPKSFMFLPGDKVVLRVISEVCKQVLESYQSVLSPHEKKNKSKSTTFSSGKQFTAMTGKSGSDQLTSKVDSDILVDEEATTTVNKLTLEEYLLRWENRLKLQNMSSLFSIKENIITCLMKQWNSAICKCQIKAQRDSNGHWKISNYTKLIQQIHLSKPNNISAKSASDGDLRNFFSSRN
ncbi:uncharacterized protein LOC123476905 [Daphnia magna]|uniref:uncharacterized protein LOC123476905 n=1 Tax=Daphnia magna TaxID=35525 RepID=UPI001E1BB374|nr:uncharacterized protein LOC123476905 [Daphnia magna]